MLSIFCKIAPSLLAANIAVLGLFAPFPVFASGPVIAAEASEGAIGSYTGSFDPPTLAHETLIRDAVSHYHLNKLYVFVNSDGKKNYKSSDNERIEMLKLALGDLKDKIVFISAPSADKKTKIQELAQQSAHSPHSTFYQFVGEDSFQNYSRGVLGSNEHIHWVIFRRPGDVDPAAEKPTSMPAHFEYQIEPSVDGISSTKARTLIQEGKSGEGILNPRVAEFIHTHGLYPSYPKELSQLQQTLHQQGFDLFTARIHALMPKLDLSSLPMPPFEPAQSQEGRGSLFVRWIAEQKHLTGHERAELEAKAKPLLSQIPYLQHGRTISEPRTKPILKTYNDSMIRKASQLKPASSIQSLESLDLRTQQIPIFVHDGTEEEALALHRMHGFDEVYGMSLGQDAHELSNPKKMIIRNSSTGDLAYVWPGLSSEAALMSAKEQLAETFGNRKIRVFRHETKAPLFAWNGAGKALKIGPTDEVIFDVSKYLDESAPSKTHWKVDTLTSNGTVIRLFSDPKTGRRIISPEKVFGDEMLEVLERLHEHGAKNFYLLKAEPPKQRANAKAKRLNSISLQTQDVEGRYLSEFLKKHSDSQGGTAFMEEQGPLGSLKYVVMKDPASKVRPASQRWQSMSYGDCIRSSAVDLLK